MSEGWRGGVGWGEVGRRGRIARTFMSAAISSVFSPRRWKRKRSKFDEIPMSIDGVIVSATPFGESE